MRKEARGRSGDNLLASYLAGKGGWRGWGEGGEVNSYVMKSDGTKYTST